jgi:sortase A
VKVRPSVWRSAQRLLLWLGIAILAYAGGTVAYVDAYQRYQSRKFEQDLAATADIKAEFAEDTADLREGDVIGRLDVPRFGISVIVLQGIAENTLTVGAGHVPETPLPGAAGNIVIAAHRDTFFRKLDGIRPGDSIQVVTLRGPYEYIVDSTEVVDPDDIQVMESRGRPETHTGNVLPVFTWWDRRPNRVIVHPSRR